VISSPLVAGGLAKDIGLGNDGGNAVLLIDLPVSQFCGIKIGQLMLRVFIWLDDVVHPYFSLCTC